MRDNIVGDSASVLGIRKRSNSSYVHTTTSGLGSEGIERFFVTAIPPQQRIRMFVMMNSHTKSGIYIKIFCVNSQWYERASETFAGLPVGRLERSFYTDSTYDVCMYVVAVDNESKLFYCMMTLTA